MVSAPARREQVRYTTDKGLSQRHTVAVVGVSASSLRYVPHPDQYTELRRRILELAHRHKRKKVPKGERQPLLHPLYAI